MNEKRIGIAMSGGVDSTATALKLRDHNSIHGFFMRLSQPDIDQQIERVTSLASTLNIPLTIIDLQQEFSDLVLDYVSNSYFSGKTPNPCVVCNNAIKFGLFQKAIFDAGMDYMATGHYAKITSDLSGYHLHDGVDASKNQSYFLSRLSQHQLSRLIFPLGDHYKEDIYNYVKEHGLTDFEGIESQDVCFLTDQSMAGYLEVKHPEKVVAGDIVSTTGEKLGTHKGLFRYTIGQRRGLNLPDSSPWYVSGIDTENNLLIVCKNHQLESQTIEVTDLNWISGKQPVLDNEYTVRIRYSHKGSSARLNIVDHNTIRMHFQQKQRAITPGQFAVIYNGSEVLGSGVIVR